MWLVLVGVLVFSFVLYRRRRRRVHELGAKIPAPPDIDNIFGVMRYVHKGFDVLLPLLQQYSQYCMGRTGVVKLMTEPFFYVGIVSREDAEFVLKNCLVKDNVTSLFDDIFGNAGIWARVPIWTQRRKMLLPAFSPKVLKSFIDIQAKQAQMLVEQLSLDGRVGTGPFKMWNYINAYTLSAITESALGVKLDAIKNPHNLFLKAMADIFELMIRRALEIWWWPEWLYMISPLRAKIKKTTPILHGLPDKIIKERRKFIENIFTSQPIRKGEPKIFGQDTDGLSFVDHLIISSLQEKGLSDLELREEVLVMLLAGTDSSAVAIGYTLQLLAMYPHVQDKLYNEIYSVFGNSDRCLDVEDLKNLDYLHKVVKESLRLFPPVPVIARNTESQEIKLPDSGFTLPANTGCVISLWGLNRDPKYWGPDADHFNPDRMWDDSLQTASFSLGPRNCVGYKYALQSVQIAVASVVRRYRVVGRPQTGPAPHIPSTYSVMMRSSDDFTLALETR